MSRPFVGRVPELAALTALLDQTLAGRGRLVMVAGEAGAGKTRLIEEVLNRAKDRGLATAWANCWPGEGTPPLWLWGQALRAVADGGLTVDAGLLDQLTEGQPSTGLLGDVDPVGARFRLFDRVVTGLCAAADQRPLVLALDDLQWADRSSLQLLLLLASTLRPVRLVVLGTYRDVEMSSNHALSHLLAELSRDAERLSLPGLTHEEVAELAVATADGALDDRFVATLHDRTGGNPFFVKELVRLLVAQDGLGEPGWLPAGVREVLDRRLARLSQRCYETLCAAAVIGRDFSTDLLTATVWRGQEEILDLLDEAVAARIVVETEPDTFAFVHDLFRQALYDDLGRARQQRLHVAVGKAIEAGNAVDIETHLDELAHHFFASRSIAGPERALTYAARAGKRAVRLLAFDEAVGHYQRAVLALPEGGPSAARAELLLALGDARWRAQEIAGAKSALEEAAAIARALGSGEMFAESALA